MFSQTKKLRLDKTVKAPLLRIAACSVMLAFCMPAASMADDMKMVEDQPAVETLSTVVVNGIPITEAELGREINRIAPVAEYHNLSEKRWKDIRNQAIDNLIDKELFYREAIHRGIEWDEQWVEYTFEKNREAFANDAHAREIFDNEQVKNRLYEDLRRTYVISKLWQSGQDKTAPKEEEIKEYFLNNRDKYKAPLSIEVYELLIEMKPSSTKQEWDKAKNRIKEIYEQTRDDSSFTDDYQEEEDIKVSKKMIHEGMHGYDLKQIKELSDGETSEPLFTLKGYIILKKIKTIPGVSFAYDEVQTQVKNDLHNIKYQQWVESLRKELRDKANIIIGAGPAYVGR